MSTLGYWNIRGIAQPIRFLLAYLGVKYTEKVYNTSDEWFQKDKNDLGLEYPNLPYFIDADIKICESQAIPYYLIKKYKKLELLGQNPDCSYNEKEVRVQQVIGVLKDLHKEITGLVYNPQFEAQKNQIYQEKLSVFLNKLVAHLANKEFLVGTLTYADFLFYEALQYFKHIYPQSITPVIASYLTRFENLPGIKEYLAKPTVNLNVYRPVTLASWSGPK